jgi:3-hydroxybutyryl-CoA dehydrogenase
MELRQVVVMKSQAVPSTWAIGVVGSGAMGAGIAEVAARSGCRVHVVDSSVEALSSAKNRIGTGLERAEAKGRLSAPADVVLSRLSFSTDLASLNEVTLVVEAIRESLADKRELMARLDSVVSESTVLATNTSSIPISKLASGTRHPGRVLGLHFFNPAPVMPLVELVPSVLTDKASADIARTFAADVLGKTVITAPDRAGFVVNAILVPYLLSAIRSLQDGVATREEIDEGMVGGCGMPMGPLALSDLIGLDTLQLVAESLYQEYLDPAYAAPPILRRHVDADLLGRKSGRGFFTYPANNS